ncbi:MAG TPA: hypothetical protein VNH11_23555 [Pirellulales bacterium]|nr:hypothetical protein [Pirellulales bacterium]
MGNLVVGASLEEALKINPFRADIHAELSRITAAAGRLELSERHRRMSQRLKADATEPPDSD